VFLVLWVCLVSIESLIMYDRFVQSWLREQLRGVALTSAIFILSACDRILGKFGVSVGI